MIIKNNFFTFLFILTASQLFAVDRIVQENGPSGTFNTISEAITASIDGDRIIIYPKIGDSPYVENININKALEFATAQDGVRYKIQGNITIQASNNRKVTIVGAHLVSGNIEGTSLGWRTNVNIMGCVLEGGTITFNNQYYVTIVSNILNSGSILISHGAIIGNELINQSHRILISNSTSIPNDEMYIVANKVTRIECSSNIFLNIYNNFLRHTSLVGSNLATISYTFNSNGVTKLKLINNTILTPRYNSTNISYFLNLNSPAIIKNNIFQRFLNGFGNDPGFVIATLSNVSYNYYNNIFGISGGLNSDVSSTPIVDSLSGNLIVPTTAQNGSDPSFEFYDLDLSPGDAGCYGGSYSLDNYFPITGSSRVFWVDVPFGITTTGAPLQIKAESFDR